MKRTLATLAVVALLVTAGCAGSASTGQNTDQTAGDSTAAAQTQATTETATATSTPPEPKTYNVTVVEIIDGDTYRVKFPDGHKETVSLIGVDTPSRNVSEVNMSKFEGIANTSENRSFVADVGQEAHRKAQIHIRGEEVTITTVPSASKTTDENGNMLVYLTVEFDHGWKGLYQTLLLDYGRSMVTDTEHPRMEEFKQTETQSKNEYTGLWLKTD